MNSSTPVRVRFAPSPTGMLHIGGLRTALYNYLLARRTNGTFLLRIEDTDQSRFVAEAEKDITDSLRWSGLEPDEGPDHPAEHGPYKQSERGDLYRRYANELLSSGKAYIAFDTPEEIDAMRKRLTEAGQTSPGYNVRTRESMSNSLTLDPDEVTVRTERGDAHVIRLKVDAGQTITFTDAIRGEVSFESEEVDDQVLVKSDGMPTYHLANVVDDHHMQITHVIRGEEWLPSTPKHVLLYEAFGWTHPTFAHLPLILSPTGGKLSKRNAEKQGLMVSVAQYREAGYLPGALINYLALLGWNPGDDRELMDLDELVDSFSLDRVGSNGVQFDMAKLLWFNEQYLRRADPAEFMSLLTPHLEAKGFSLSEEELRPIADLLRERLSFPSEIIEKASFFLGDVTSYDEKAVKKGWKPDTNELLTELASDLNKLEAWSLSDIQDSISRTAEANDVKAGRLMLPLRLAMTGVTNGPGIVETMEILGKNRVLSRIEQAVGSLEATGP